MRHLIETNFLTNGRAVFKNESGEVYAESQSFRVGFKNATGDGPAEVAIYGEIGNEYDAADARSVTQFLRANKGRDVSVRINSGGGLAYDGITIHNALVAHDGKVTCTVEGMAASAASIIAMAGYPLQMYENAQLMIHRASVVAVGNRDMMAEAIDWLDKIDDSIARTYKAKTGKALDKIKDMMKGKVAGTVMTARDAKEMGFADEVLSLKTGAANFSPLRAEGEKRLQSVESARAERLRTRRELFSPLDTVPSNPPNGSGEGVDGEWSKLRLQDFTNKGWGDVEAGEREKISKFFAYYSNLDDFGNLHLGHHFPPNHSSNGKASLNGVRAALARLNQVEGMPAEDRKRAQAHLEAHLPKDK